MKKRLCHCHCCCHHCQSSAGIKNLDLLFICLTVAVLMDVVLPFHFYLFFIIYLFAILFMPPSPDFKMRAMAYQTIPISPMPLFQDDGGYFYPILSTSLSIFSVVRTPLLNSRWCCLWLHHHTSNWTITARWCHRWDQLGWHRASPGYAEEIQYC